MINIIIIMVLTRFYILSQIFNVMFDFCKQVTLKPSVGLMSGVSFFVFDRLSILLLPAPDNPNTNILLFFCTENQMCFLNVVQCLSVQIFKSLRGKKGCLHYRFRRFYVVCSFLYFLTYE